MKEKEKKEKRLSIRFSIKEFVELQQIADNLGLTPSSLLRALWKNPAGIGQLVQKEREKLKSKSK